MFLADRAVHGSYVAAEAAGEGLNLFNDFAMAATPAGLEVISAFVGLVPGLAMGKAAWLLLRGDQSRNMFMRFIKFGLALYTGGASLALTGDWFMESIMAQKSALGMSPA